MLFYYHHLHTDSSNSTKGTAFEAHIVGHGRSLFPSSASGVPWTTSYIKSQEDPLPSLYEDMAAEQKQDHHIIA